MGRPIIEQGGTQGQRPDQFRVDVQKPADFNGNDEFQGLRPPAYQQQLETGATHHTVVPPFEVMPNSSIHFLDDRYNVQREPPVNHGRSRKNKRGFVRR